MTIQKGETVELEKLWRIRLVGKEPMYQEVRATKPMIDDKGMLGFANVSGELQIMVAAGAWAFVVPVSEERKGRVLRFNPQARPEAAEAEPAVEGEPEAGTVLGGEGAEAEAAPPQEVSE